MMYSEGNYEKQFYMRNQHFRERVQKDLTRIPNGSPVILFRGSIHRLKFVYSARDLDVRFCSVTSRIFCLNINLI